MMYALHGVWIFKEEEAQTTISSPRYRLHGRWRLVNNKQASQANVTDQSLGNFYFDNWKCKTTKMEMEMGT